ncbi:MAG TPA: alpha/beta fold hydrolase [Nocardioidaceae bacterium]|jgi:hypothetical protein
MARFLVVVVVVASVLVATLWLLQRRLIYFPDTGTVPPAATVIPGARDVTLRPSDGLELGAWFVPADEAGHGLTVLVANGNAGSRTDRAPLAEALADRGFGVLLFDYRGYGGNPGSPSEEALARDVRAAYDFLVSSQGIEPDRLIYFGESLGAAVVTELATEYPPRAMVLRSPFVDLAAVGQVHYPFLPVRLLLRDEFPVADRIASVETPVAVVYGSKDSVVPPRQSREVAAAARNAVVVEVDADHNDARLTYGDEVIDAVQRLAEQVD